MQHPKKIISEDNLTISRYTAQIPVDLLIDIFLRVPSKSIARFRCVSKSWASILGRPYFTELFLTKSLNHPRLLFIVRSYGKLYFFSSPQIHNPDVNLSLVATRYHTHSFDRKPVSSLHGLVCCQDRYSKNPTPVICNPVTGESLTLPEEKSVLFFPRNYSGYDPIDRQYKVLSVTSKNSRAQVLTLETGKCLWRTIECKPHYRMSSHGICIDGVLYYCSFDLQLMDSIVCFDVRSEKFSFINIDKESMRIPAFTLINYKGKLGGVYFIDTNQTRLRLLSLEVDAGKNKWSSNIYELPLWWKHPYTYHFHNFDIVGMTGTGDIVLSPDLFSDPFYVFYYNIERKTLARVEIQGLQELKFSAKVYTFLDYVEDVKLMKSL